MQGGEGREGWSESAHARVGEREREGEPLAPLFMFFSPPWACPTKTRLRRERSAT